MARSILGANAELSRWGSAQASLCRIDSRKDSLFLHRRELHGETEFHSTATDGSSTSQVKRGITARWWAFMGEGLQEGKHPTVRRARASNTERRSKDDFWAKLDGLTTRSTAASRT